MLLLVFVISIFSIHGNYSFAAIKNIKISATSTSIQVGQSVQLVTTANYKKGVLKWSSSNLNVASVSSTGVLLGKREGIAMVTVLDAASKVSGKLQFKVTKKIVQVQSIIATLPKMTMTPGKTVKAKISILPANATNKSLSWESSDENVATVDEYGNITAVDAGEAVIYVTHPASSIQTTIEIVVNKVKLTSLIPDQSNIELNVGESRLLFVTTYPENVTGIKLIWSSSNTNVVKVDSFGNIEGVNSGSATIIVKEPNSNLQATISVIVGAKKKTAQEIYNLVNPSVGYVEMYGFDNALIGSGSGFLVKSDGTFVTNYHVIYDTESPVKYVTIKFGDGRFYSNVTQVIDYDASNDIAVLKIPGITNASYLQVGNVNLINTGDNVLAIGSPRGLENTLSQGIVSSKSRLVGSTTYIQISVPIDHGSSGGALVNMEGEVIGVTTAGIGTTADLNLAVPISIYQAMSLNKFVTITDLNKVNVVYGLSSGEKTYTEIENNNTFSNADVLTHNTTYMFGSFSSSSDVDCFVVTISKSTKVTMIGKIPDSDNIMTMGMGMGIYDSNGKSLAYSTLKTSTSYPYDYYRLIEYYLSPGTYYFEVFPYDYLSLFNLKAYKHIIGFWFN